MMGKIFGALLVFIAGLGMAGCGSGDSEPLPPSVKVAKPGDPGPLPKSVSAVPSKPRR